MLGSIRAAVGESIALLAADIERRSARTLGTEGLAQRNGFKDGAGFLQDLVGLRRDEAARLIRVGGLLETAAEMAPLGEVEPGADPAGASPPPVPSLDVLRGLDGPWDGPIAVALKNGWLSAAQSEALRSRLGRPRSPEFEAAWQQAVIELIGDCWSGHWNPEEVARAATRFRVCLDTTLAAQEAQQRYELRSFKRVQRSSGMVHYDIDLDPESDSRFYGPIKRLLSPRFGGPRFTTEADVAAAGEIEADPRSNEQLQVDTLIDLVDRAVNCDNGTLFKTREPQVMIAVTTAELARARDGEPGIAFIDGRDEPITAADALRLICTSGFTPILFDESGQTLDLGKDRRYFTHQQRRAIAKRDGGCTYPGCGRPPEDGEYHHINPWAQHPGHRRTEARDGILLCRRHHKMIHDHGARIARDADGCLLHWPGRSPVRLHSKSGIEAQLRAERRRT